MSHGRQLDCEAVGARYEAPIDVKSRPSDPTAVSSGGHEVADANESSTGEDVEDLTRHVALQATYNNPNIERLFNLVVGGLLVEFGQSLFPSLPAGWGEAALIEQCNLSDRPRTRTPG